MHPDTDVYNQRQDPPHREVCVLLAQAIDRYLPEAENKVWHGHPVWFLDGNPVAGYSRQKPGIRLMFWSGADFGEVGLSVLGKKFRNRGQTAILPACSGIPVLTRLRSVPGNRPLYSAPSASARCSMNPNTSSGTVLAWRLRLVAEIRLPLFRQAVTSWARSLPRMS